MRIIQIIAYGIFITFLSLSKVHAKDSIHLISRDCGFFSVFMDVINILEAYDADLIKGVKVDFGKTGLYYDKQMGENWWEYYFDPIDLGDTMPPFRSTSGLGEYNFKHHAYDDHYNVIKKYVHVKGYIHNYIQDFVHENFDGYYMIGVHYRGTDKRTEAGRVSYDKMLTIIEKTIEKSPENWKIFLATDEQKFLQKLIDTHLERVCYIDANRSLNDNSPVHIDNKDNPSKNGQDALLDCILLSKTDILVRTASNLSECCRYFNPELPVVFVCE